MCSSGSPSMTAAGRNSIGQASLPGASTTAWAPSWKAPSSKLVRVRREGLKNTRAIDLPRNWSPRGWRLSPAALASSACSSARLQSWVLRKCFIGGFLVEGRKAEDGKRKTKKPSTKLGFQADERERPAYPAAMRDSGRRAREVMPAAMRAELRTVAARSCVMGGQYAGAAGGGASAGSVVPGGRVRGHRHPHPQPVARIVGQPGQVLLALVHVLDVVADQLPLLAFDLDQPAGPLVGVGDFLLLADVVADGVAGGGPGHGGDLAAIALADLVADRSTDDGADHGAGGGLARLPVFDLVATLLGGAGDHGFVDPVGA